MRLLIRSFTSSAFLVGFCVLLGQLLPERSDERRFNLSTRSVVRAWVQDGGEDILAHCEEAAVTGMTKNSRKVCTALRACNEVAGDVRYLRIHFCVLRGLRVPSTLFFTVWLACLIYIMVWIAEDYLCPSLAGIADSLQLSPEVAGVTFLALGNGSPDIRYALTLHHQAAQQRQDSPGEPWEWSGPQSLDETFSSIFTMNFSTVA